MVPSMSATSRPLRRPRERVSSTSTWRAAKRARMSDSEGPNGEGAPQGMSAASPGDRIAAGWPDTRARASSMQAGDRLAASRRATRVRV